MLTDSKAFLGSLSHMDQEVLHLLVIDLEHRQVDFELLILVRVLMNAIEDLLATDRHDALVRSVADHGVGFAGPSLPVRKQAAMVAQPCIVEDFLADGLVYKLLIGVLRASFPKSRQLLLEVARGVGLEVVVRPE
jgi:hypothetical protein